VDKSLLLKEVSTFIKENSPDLSSVFTELNILDEKNSPSSLSEKLGSIREYLPLSKLLQTITRLEQRLEAVEKQNDNLLYFIHFIYENFNELANGYFPSGPSNGKSRIGNKIDSLATMSDNPPSPRLTPRESEVLECLVRGFAVKEIAAKLFISRNTVITHKKNLKEKFNARNTVDMIAKAFQFDSETPFR